MKPKTITESIADLRSKLDSIESKSNQVLNESIQPVNRLQAHMQMIEQEYLEEGLFGAGVNAVKNFGRGMGLDKAKGALVKNPKVPGQKATWSRGPKTTADKVANVAGKATDAAIAGGVAIAGDRWLNDKPMPWSDDNKPPVPPPTPPVPPPTPPVPPPNPNDQDTNEVPDLHPDNGGGGDQGTENKPHYQYDPKAEKLQQFLNGQGANLAVDGKFGPQTQAAWQAYQQGKLSKPHPTPHPKPNASEVPNVPPTGDTTSTSGGTSTQATPNADAEVAELLQQLRQAVGEVQGMVKNDPGAQQDLQQILQSAGLQ